MNPAICDAMRRGVCLDLRYDGYSRVVEVHAYGQTKDGHDVMRVWQVRGGSVSNEPHGFKLLRLDETTGLHTTGEAAQAPRQGYKRGDRAMQWIYCEL